jgi:hypothetical protein
MATLGALSKSLTIFEFRILKLKNFAVFLNGSLQPVVKASAGLSLNLDSNLDFYAGTRSELKNDLIDEIRELLLGQAWCAEFAQLRLAHALQLGCGIDHDQYGAS